MARFLCCTEASHKHLLTFASLTSATRLSQKPRVKDSFVLRKFNIWVRNDWLNSVFNPSILIREVLRLREKKKEEEEEEKKRRKKEG